MTNDKTAGDAAIPVGVKLGSTRTVIAVPDKDGHGLQTSRTLTCLAQYEDRLTGEKTYLYGDEAATQYPDRAEFMLRSGLPEDEKRTERTKQFFNAVIDSHDIPKDSVVVYAIPTINNPVGLENLRNVIENSRIGKQHIESYPEPLCGSIPAFGEGLKAIETAFVALNMGGTTFEATVYKQGEQIGLYRTSSVTGNEVDRIIANNVEDETQGRVNIDRNTAREYKEEYADFESFEPFSEIVQQPGGGRHEFTIEWSITDAMEEYLDAIVDEFENQFLSQLASNQPQIYQLALDQPVVLTGGMACIPGITAAFEKRVTDVLGREIDTITPDRADLAPAVGAQRIAARLAQTN